jgi:hypothetical protein
MGMSFARSEHLNRLALRPNERIYAGPTIAAPPPDATAEIEGLSVKHGTTKSEAPHTKQEVLVAQEKHLPNRVRGEIDGHKRSNR